MIEKSFCKSILKKLPLKNILFHMIFFIIMHIEQLYQINIFQIVNCEGEDTFLS